MAYNDRKIIQVLLGELNSIPERYKDYRNDLGHLLGDVLHFEHQHTINKTSVVKKIADQVNTVGMSLYKSRPNSEEDEGKDHEVASRAD